MGLDSPNHTKSGPSGARFFQDVIRHRHGKEKFDTSGKSPASVHHRRDSLVRRADWSRRRNPPLDLKRWRVTASPPTRPTSSVPSNEKSLNLARRADWSRRRNPPLGLKRWRVTASPPTRPTSYFVMAGLVPAIHDLSDRTIKKDVDARDEPGHDELRDPAIETRPFFLHRQPVLLRQFLQRDLRPGTDVLDHFGRRQRP
jgi:hypothetical protein